MATGEKSEQPMREFDMAMYAAIEILIDVFLRAGTPAEEFDKQFRAAANGAENYPKYQAIMEALRRYANERARVLSEELKERLKHGPTEGSA